MYTTIKRIGCILLALVLLASAIPKIGLPVSAATISLAEMRSRAEAIVNYTWTPSRDISTWNGNPYNGKTYFPKGVQVKGVPYTLFTSEVVSNSLCSLSQYKAVASSNYSTTAYCRSTRSTRTGPVYGSCCVDLVCEVFGGSFMNGSSPRYHYVPDIQNCSYATTTKNVKAANIVAGDALCDTGRNHIIWVGEVTDSAFVIYEQTPPVARKTTISKTSVNSNGYLVYGGEIYSTVVKSKEFTADVPGKPKVTPGKTTYNYGETAKISWNAVSGATSYWLDLYVDGVHAVSKTMGTSTSYSAKVDVLGSYSVYVTAVNSAGKTLSDACKFTVAAQPSTVSVKVKNHSAAVSWTDVGASSYYMYVYNKKTGGTPYGKNQGTNLKCDLHLSAGDYIAYVTAVYTDDIMVSSSFPFSLYNYSTTTNKGANASFAVNEKVAVSVNADKGDFEKCYYVLYCTPVGGTRVLLEENTITNNAFSKSFTQPGKYECSFGVHSSYGYTESEYVTWYVKEEYTVKYNTNGGSGAPASQTKLKGDTLILSSTVPQRDLHIFLGWAKKANSTSPQYMPGDEFAEDGNTTLYAVWSHICADGHRWNSATCTAPKTCSVCKTTEGSAAGHKWSNATCTAPKTCSVCKTTEGSAAGHKWVGATCTTAKTCSVCKTTEGSAAGHKWVGATCTAPKTCSVCKTTEGSAAGHKWSNATCTAPKTCSVCKATEGKAAGHKWVGATCTAAKTCSVCKATEGSAVGHKWAGATCTAAKTCSVCKATEGSAAGHKWSNATCTAPKTCSVCKTTEGSAAGHKWSNAICTAPKTCSVCKATGGKAKGHSFTNGKCGACGAADPDYKEQGTTTTPTGENDLSNYIAAVENAIVLMKKGPLPYDGCGFLCDVDGNGVKELVLVYSSMGKYNDGFDCQAKLCSVYTMESGKVVPLLEENVLFLLAGGPSGTVSVVEKDGKKYFATETFGYEYNLNDVRKGTTWELYSINGTNIKRESLIESQQYRSSPGNSILYSKSYATFNGTKVTYKEYEAWLSGVKKGVTIDLAETNQKDPNMMTLQELLDYLRNLPEQDNSGKAAVSRLAGATRYDTAFRAADELKQKLGVTQFSTVVVASGTNFPDALAGTYLAAVKNAPILLVKGSTANAVKDYIKANLVPGGTVYILGDEEAVPKTMNGGERLSGFKIKRLGGKTRYDTNLLILKEAGVAGKDIVVCTGKGFADSLSASALGLPILLVKDSFTDAQKEFLAGVTGDIYIIGGTKAVSSRLETQLKSYGSVKRVSGSDRYETSVQVATTFFGSPARAVLAYGENFPDGLSGGPVAYFSNAPMLLTRSGKETAATTYMAKKNIVSGYVMGDESVITKKTENKVFGKN